MNIYNRVKLIREDKKYSQEYIAHELGLSQSQYSRRENGEIKFVPQEIRRLAKLLETSVSDLFGEDTTIFNNHDQKGGNFGQHITLSEKVIDLYEARLKEKDKSIDQLLTTIKTQGETITFLRKKKQ